MEIIGAFILDLIFGDPRWLPHPVRGIGWAIKKLEYILYRIINKGFFRKINVSRRKNQRGAGKEFSPRFWGDRERSDRQRGEAPMGSERSERRMGGSILTAIIVTGTYFLTSLILMMANFINPYFKIAISIFLIYTALAIKDLNIEATDVYRELKRDNLEGARRKLTFIVGRDTANLNREEIIRATVETVAESTVDGIISPLFYAFIGGAPLALAYKAVNTLDSMVGYKNEKYRDFGWASAKLDDLANFIPVRLSAIFLPFASWLAGYDSLNSWRIIWRDGRKNPTPNNSIPEAAIAGALRVQLGSLNFYDSMPVLKPILGDNLYPLRIEHIKASIKISYICSILFVTIGLFLIWLIKK